MNPEAMTRAIGGKIIRPPLMIGRLRVLSMDDIGEAEPRDYLIKRLLSPAEMSLWWGPPKSGKSFLLTHVSYAVAQDRSVFGRRVKGCPVLYVAAEGEAGIAKRLRAIRDEHGHSPNFHTIAQPIDLLHPGNMKEGYGGHLEEIAAAAKDRRIGAGLIVIDTLNRALAGGDENAPVDMGQFITNVGLLRTQTGAHVAIVHHGTKNPTGSTPRGHGSLIGAADVVIEIAKVEGGARTATVTAAKDDPDGIVMGFKLRVVEMGTDTDGDAITTLVVDELSEALAPVPSSRLSQSDRTARTFLADLINAEGKPLPSSPDYPAGLCGAAEERWRDICESRRLSSSDKRDSRTKAFNRAYASLLAAAEVASRDGLVWLTRPEPAP